MVHDMTELTETERMILGLERLWWQYPGAKDQEIRDRFDMSRTEYDLELLRIIRTEAARAYDPLLVKRLHRIVGTRKRSRPTSGYGLEI